MTSNAGAKGHITAKGRLIQHPDNVETNAPTKGPYIVAGPDDDGNYQIIGAALRGLANDRVEVVVANVNASDVHVEGEAKANAYLLAMSHNLLFELQQFVAGVEQGAVMTNQIEIMHDVLTRSRAAIKLAGG